MMEFDRSAQKLRRKKHKGKERKKKEISQKYGHILKSHQLRINQGIDKALWENIKIPTMFKHVKKHGKGRQFSAPDNDITEDKNTEQYAFQNVQELQDYTSVLEQFLNLIHGHSISSDSITNSEKNEEDDGDVEAPFLLDSLTLPSHHLIHKSSSSSISSTSTSSSETLKQNQSKNISRKEKRIEMLEIERAKQKMKQLKIHLGMRVKEVNNLLGCNLAVQMIPQKLREKELEIVKQKSFIHHPDKQKNYKIEASAIPLWNRTREISQICYYDVENFLHSSR